MIPVSKKNEVLKESISIYTLENGMKCYLIPKKDYDNFIALLELEIRNYYKDKNVRPEVPP